MCRAMIYVYMESHSPAWKLARMNSPIASDLLYGHSEKRRGGELWQGTPEGEVRGSSVQYTEQVSTVCFYCNDKKMIHLQVKKM